MSITYNPLVETTHEVENLKLFTGVKYSKLFRFDSWVHALVIDKGAGEFNVTKGGRKTVSQVQRETGADIVINGSDYFSSGRSNGLHWVLGKFQSPQVDYQPFVNFTKTHLSEILPWNKWTVGYNSLSGKRYIVVDGKVSLRTSAAWYEEHPRTLVGVGANGETILVVADGRQDNLMTGFTQGLDLFEAAQVMVSLGAVTAIDLDGGGSSTMNVGGTTMNSPIDENIVGKERFVGNHITFKSIDIAPPPVVVEPPPTNTNEAEYIVEIPVRPRPAPSMFSISTQPNLTQGLVFMGTESNGWVKIPTGYYVPLTWLGKTYVRKNVHVEPGAATFGITLDKWWVDYGKSIFEVMNVPPRFNSLPAAVQFVQLNGDKAVLITRSLANWWYKQQKAVCPPDYPHTELVKTLLNLTMGKKAFTNKIGWDEENGNRREYWSGEGEAGKKEDMGLLFVFTAGSTYKVIGEKRISGKECWVVEAMDALDPATLEVNYWEKPWLFTIATSNSRAPEVLPYKFIVNPFPRLYDRSLDNFSRVLVPLLVNGRKEMYVEKKYMKILPEGATIPAYPYREP